MRLILLLFAASNIFAQERFDRMAFRAPAYNTIQEVSEEVRAVKTQSSPVFVGIGRSPTPIIAYLQNQNEMAINLPFSQGGGVESTLRVDHAMKAELELYKNLKPHFDKFLGKSLVPGKEVIMMDYSGTGLSYSLEYRLMTRYLHEACPTCRMKAVVLTDNVGFLDLRLESKFPSHSIPENVRIIDLSKKGSYQNFANYLRGGAYNIVAEYDAYPAFGGEEIKKNDAYEVFKKQMATKLPGAVTEKASPPLVCPQCSTARGTAITPRITPILNITSMFLSLAAFIPMYNPYHKTDADIIGFDCSLARSALNRMGCNWDLEWSPFNNWVVCSKALSVSEIGTNADGKKMCSSVIQTVAFDCRSSVLKKAMNAAGLFNKTGVLQPSTDGWLKYLKEEYSIKPDTFIKTYPEKNTNENFI